MSVFSLIITKSDCSPSLLPGDRGNLGDPSGINFLALDGRSLYLEMLDSEWAYDFNSLLVLNMWCSMLTLARQFCCWKWLKQNRTKIC